MTQATPMSSISRPIGSYLGNWFERFYLVITSPKAAMKQLSAVVSSSTGANILLWESFWIIVKISALGPLLQYVTQGGSWSGILFSIVLGSLSGVVAWVLCALILGLLAYSMGRSPQIQRLLILSAHATLVWIFLAPITMLKEFSGGVGVLLGGILGLLVWLWSAWLFALALQTAYSLRLGQLVCLLILPWALSLIWTAWVIGFIANLIQLLS